MADKKPNGVGKGLAAMDFQTKLALFEEKYGKPSEDVPNTEIFTSEFLNHNEARQADFCRLKKEIRGLEDQLLLLEKHLEDMMQVNDTLCFEQRESGNENLEERLDKLKKAFIEKFADVALPTTGEKPTKDNIMEYVSEILAITEDENHPFYKTVEKIVKTINLE